MDDRLATLDHRPWPPPAGSWAMAQKWHDLLFAHWPVPIDSLRRVVPAALPLDTFCGQAWLGVVPFRMSGIRPRGLPPVPGLSAFAELNVRTYVVLDGKAGVYFFSLDAASRIGVRLARGLFRLPYFDAAMSVEGEGSIVRYRSRRIHRDAPPAEFRAVYGPNGPIVTAAPGSLAAWLTDRYCLYTAGARGEVHRCEIDHRPWPLQPAMAEIEADTMTESLGLPLPNVPPLLHFARYLDVRVWWPRRIA
jgi:uncharacterized protein